jgi:hypothetical protein
MTSRQTAVAVLLASCVWLSATVRADRAEDEKGIRDAVKLINQTWERGDILSLSAVISDKGFAVAMPRPQKPEEAFIMDKARFLQGIDWLLRNARPKKHVHHIKAITFAGPLAVELAEIEAVSAEGQRRGDEMIMLWAKDEKGWFMYSSANAAPVRDVLRRAPDDEKAVKALTALFVGVFRTEKAVPVERLADVLSDDFIQVRAKGQVRGKEANLKQYGKATDEIRTLFTRFDASYEVASVRMLGSGAVVFGQITFSGTLKEGNKPWQRVIWETLVFERTPEGWRLVQEHSSLAAPPVKR